MLRLLQLTSDGSHTISIPGWNVTYHSVHGAIQESVYVFIEAGLQPLLTNAGPGQCIHIFEMGFGTGLNALLTLQQAEEQLKNVSYTAVEAYPVDETLVAKLNYVSLPAINQYQSQFYQLHQCPWNVPHSISPHFRFCKWNTTLETFESGMVFDLIYFDAFAPNVQPELWTTAIFKKVKTWLKPGAVLVTYCSKGDARRAMTAGGLNVQKLKGPPGKREMLRAYA